MGCGDSKEKKRPEEQHQDGQPQADVTATAQNEQPPLSARSVETPALRAPGHADDVSERSSNLLPSRLSMRGGKVVDVNGNPIALPKGDWVRTEGTPYYYSALENLYYHPPSYQFYDPTNEMWYDPDKDEWYKDTEADS